MIFSIINIQHDSRALRTFVSNKLIGHSEYFTNKLYLLRNIRFRVPYIKVWFTDQNSMPLEIEHRQNLTLVINGKGIKWDLQLNPEIEFMSGSICFYPFQNTWLKILAVNIDKSLLISQKFSNRCTQNYFKKGNLKNDRGVWWPGWK